jgi:valyl-tRNA synthetase
VVRAVRNLRSEYNVPPSRPIDVGLFVADAAVRARLTDVLPLMATLARAEPLALLDRPERPRNAAVESVAGVELIILLTGLIDDLGAEATRIAREVEKVVKELAGIEAKLGNPQFVERAPEEIIAEVEEKGTQLRERRDTLERSLERLRSLAP